MSVYKWSLFAQRLIRDLACVKPGERLLIMADTNTNLDLAQAVLSAGLQVTQDAHMMIFRRMPYHERSELNPVMEEAMVAADVVIYICESRVMQTKAILRAREAGTRILNTEPKGIEDFLIEGMGDVDYDAMVYNHDLVGRIWEETEECLVRSRAGTDLRFRLRGRPFVPGTGVIREPGAINFFPGVQANIAPVEETINGTIVVDGSLFPTGVVSSPVTVEITAGRITSIAGGAEAVAWRNWVESLNDDLIYRLCHFTIGLNPRAKMVANMIEAERVLGGITFGFGSQSPVFGGTVGQGRFHMDVVLRSGTIICDGEVMLQDNQLNPDLGFKPMG